MMTPEDNEIIKRLGIDVPKTIEEMELAVDEILKNEKEAELREFFELISGTDSDFSRAQERIKERNRGRSDAGKLKFAIERMKYAKAHSIV